MSTYGYCRVSTQQQADEGQSLAVQRRQIVGYALLQGLHLSKVFLERGVSGSTPLAERPAGGPLLAKLKAGDTLILPKLDRAFRSASDALAMLEDFKKRGITLVILDLGGSVTDNTVAKLIFTILAAVSETEAARIRERIRDQKSDAKQRRVFTGVRPFGWKIVETSGDREKRLVPDPVEQACFAEIFAMRAKGLSYHRIAAAIRDRGVHISHMTVKRILIGLIKPEKGGTP